MSTPQSTKSLSVIPGSLIRDVIGRYIANRWFLLAAAGLAFAVAAAFSWSWLVAAGIASILVSVLPCLVMCGLGLCMHKFLGSSGSARAPGSAVTQQPNTSPQTAADSATAYVASCCSGGSPVTPANSPGEDSAQPKEKTNA